MTDIIDKQYDPRQVEDRIYDFWMENGFFKANPDSGKQPYTVMMPPPNITGQLHMGHALNTTQQDTLVRYKRMQGFETLYLPGTDHASIATEAKIVEALKQEGVTKEDLGRDGFLERAWQWREKYGTRIVEQQKKMGISADWSRTRFTLDEGCNKAVLKFFTDLYEKGLIYRGERLVNWCPNCDTSISDIEVEFEEHQGNFYHIRYPIKDSDEYLEIATTRPETMLGDSGVAVHPDDERYAHLVGKMAILPLVGRELPIVADSYVEKDFGTGVVKMTPAHDPNDYQVGLRHSLEQINIMNFDATINANGGKYAGLDRYAARKAIIKDLEEQGFLIKIEPHTHNVGCCQRCGTIIEPLLSTQWFVKMEPLAKPAIDAVRGGEIKFVPERFDATYFHWMENIKDWCISRQLWWGHRIPAYYCGDCGEIVVSADNVDTCPKCSSHSMKQDPDTLDTWFSSGLWPFSTLGWPDNTRDLECFYPTSTLVTAYDIIFFWVARMIFSGIECTGKVPFDTVFIHGMVRDAQGRKMSKSLGNGIDPLEIISQYGADALRLTLSMGNAPGGDMRFSDEKITASRNFCNKLWNAARFIMLNLGEEAIPSGLPANMLPEDKWLVSQYNRLVREVTDNLDKFELGVAATKLYDFTWDVFCDWYIELAKSRLSGDEAVGARQVLLYVLKGILSMLHPFMPFITEEIFGKLPNLDTALIISQWPVYSEELNFEAEERDFDMVVRAIKSIRAARLSANVPPSRKATVYIITDNAAQFESGAAFIMRLASASAVHVNSDTAIEEAVTVLTPEAKILIPMDELVDREKEIARLSKEKEKTEKVISTISVKLQNEGFVKGAPEAVVEAERAKLRDAETLLKNIEESLNAYKGR